ncbi:MAG: exodeoxyribonuclease V subunit gamma [Thermodesulfobacteriota bacterium]
MPENDPQPPAGLFAVAANRLETAALLLCRELAERPVSLFTQETVLVQSPAHARWLSLALARVLGVCANVRFVLHNAFLNEAFAAAVPGAGQGAEAFSPAAMAARIMAVLPELFSHPAFSELTRYAAEDPGGLRLTSLSMRIAELYDRYLLFRPEMMAAWDRGASRLWQAVLWRETAKGVPALHRPALLRALEERLRQGPVPGLPGRVTVFGAASMPLFHLRLLSLLSRHCRVLLFVHSPCRTFHAEAISRRRSVRLARLPGGEAFPGEQGNPLLASLGRASADFQFLLADFCGDPEDAHQVPERASLLSFIQADVVSFTDPAHLPAKRTVAQDDDSIAVCSCHGPMREMEVLHDRILSCLDRDPDLAPKDFLVLLPDLSAYAPFIKAVFGGGQEEAAKLRYNLGGEYRERGRGFAEAFALALDIARSRFASPRIMDLLGFPQIRERFGIREDELAVIEGWVRETRIRWGKDAEHKRRLGLPASSANTWQAGIARLVLGYAMLAGDDRMHQGIVPAAAPGKEEADLLGRFVSFYNELFAVSEEVPESAAPSRWAGLFRDWAERLLLSTEEDAEDFRQAAAGLQDMQERWGLNRPVGFPAALAMLKIRFSGPGKGAGFFRGGVTFAPLREAAGLPFAVVCLAGMNEDAFPARVKALGFDLMKKHPLRGDRDLRNEDRLLFLLALLSARKKLMVTYTGQSVKDNHPILPAAPVSELLDYAERCFCPSGGGSLRERIVSRHRMWAFSPEYFSLQGEQKGLFTYRSSLAAACRALSKPGAAEEPSFAGLLPELSQTVALHRLESFFVNPARYFLQKRLQADLSRAPEPLEPSEPFALDGLSDYDLRQAILEHVLEGKDPDELFSVMQALGRIPHGNPGRNLFDRAAAGAAPLAGRVRALVQGAQSLSVELSLAGFTVSGTLSPVTGQGLFLYRASPIKAKDRLRAYLRHLALCLARPDAAPATCLLGLDGTEVFGQVPEAEARPILSGLLDLFARGSFAPLPFFPACSYAYAQARAEGRSEEASLEKARAQWYNEFKGRGEGTDPHAARLFPGEGPFGPEFAEIARAVFGPLLACCRGKA